MKTFFSFAIILLSFSFTSCDKVSPNEYLQQNIADTTDNSGGVTLRNVFLEDYTGHKCGNCPAAAETAAQLEALYGDRLIVMGVHAGFFARPAPSGNYTTDYSNSTSIALDNFFKISAVGNPNGMVNRTNFPNNQHVVLPSGWGSNISQFISGSSLASIKLSGTFDIEQDSLIVNMSAEALSDLNGQINYTAYVVEDSITGYQVDYRLQGSQDIPNYIHRHVMRTSLNTPFGTPLFTDVSIGAKTSIRLGGVVATNWNKQHLGVIIIAQNAVSQEVLQVIELHPEK